MPIRIPTSPPAVHRPVSTTSSPSDAPKATTSEASPPPLAAPTAVNVERPQGAAAAASANTLAGGSSGLGGAGVPRFLLDGGEKGPSAPPEPAVTQLLADYGVTKRLGRPRERLLKQVAVIQAGLAGEPNADKLLDKVVGENVRLGLFYLEGALKLYRDEYGAPMEKQYRAVKNLEDKLGAYSAASGFLQLARDNDLPAAVVAVLEEEADLARADLKEVLAAGWTPEGPSSSHVPMLQGLIDTLAGLSWQSYDDDKKYLLKEIRSELKQLAKADLDMSQLQGDTGLHELRRQLRWIPVYLVATDGLVELDDKRHPIPAYKALLDDPIATSKYARLPTGEREKKPVQLSRSLFLANTKAINDLGAIKDRGEEIEAIAHALQKAGLATTLADAEEQAARALGKEPDAMERVVQDGQRVYDELASAGLVKAMRAELKR